MRNLKRGRVKGASPFLLAVNIPAGGIILFYPPRGRSISRLMMWR